MSALAAIRGLFGARWFPYVLIAWVSSVMGAAGYCYMRGYDAAEVRHQVVLSESLSRQVRRERDQAALEVRLAIRNERARYEAQRRISEVARPVVSCELPAQCVQWFDAVLRASEAGIE